MTKDGLKKPNFFGSLTQAATVRVGNFEGEEVYAPFKALLPMVEPTDIVLGGWDISSMNMAEAMERAKVLDWSLQEQLVPYMREMVPLPGRCWGLGATSREGCRMLKARCSCGASTDQENSTPEPQSDAHSCFRSFLT